MKTVLIIDDEESIVNMYKTTLTNYNVISATNGDEGLKLAIKEKPDLIYLDIIMPKYNGLDVLRSLKQDKATSDIPVILLTNLPEEASAEKAKALGALNYFVKAEYEPDKVAEETKKILG